VTTWEAMRLPREMLRSSWWYERHLAFVVSRSQGRLAIISCTQRVY